MVAVPKIFQYVPSLQAKALIAEEAREKRATNGSKGGKGSKPRRRKAGANKSHLLPPDSPPVRDCYAALSAQRGSERERNMGTEGERDRGREAGRERDI